MPKNFITQRYQIIRPVGAGGAGEVFLVEDRWESGRKVALKRLRQEALSDRTREGLVREFTALKQLRHPNLCPVFDFGYTDQGDAYFTSEFCEGTHLIQGTEDLGFNNRLELAIEICRALSYIHARGYVHGDLKPENIVVSSDGKGESPSLKILDFGLARTFDEASRQKLGGTLAYLAPETLQGQSMNLRSDLYALGVVFYQLFTRQLPFEETDPQLLVNMQLSVSPTRPSERDNTLPSALDNVVLKLLRKNPDDRFESAEGVIRSINQLLGTQFEIDTRATAFDYIRSGRFVGRRTELGQVVQSLNKARSEHAGSLVLVQGLSGVGKTRLLEEAKIQAQLDGFRTFTVAAYEKIRQPFQCFLGVLRPLILGLQQSSADPAHLLERYANALAQVLPELIEVTGPVASPISASASERELLMESLVLFMKEALEAQPTLLVIQDIHWADGLSLELLLRLARDLYSAGIVLAVNFREDEVEGSELETVLPALSGLPGTQVISLQPLIRSEVEELVSSALGHGHTPVRLSERILQQTGGNPFFIQELLWSWMEEGITAPRVMEWEERSDRLESLPIPQSMQEAFRRRLDHLPAGQRDVLETVTLFDRPVSAKTLSVVLGKPVPGIENDLEALVENAILRREDSSEGSSYSLHHAIMKPAIESGAKPEFSQALHRAIGEYLEAEASSSPSDFSEILAYHFAAAREIKKARRYAIRAGDKLRKLFSYREAAQVYRIAEGYVDPDDIRAFEIKEKIAFCLFQEGELEASEQMYQSLVERGESKLPPGRIAKFHLRLGMITEYRGNYPQAIEINRRGLSLIEHLPEPKTKADLLARIGFEYQRMSEFRIAREYVTQALNLVEDTENYFGLADIHNSLFVIHFYLGEFQKALEAGHHAIAVFTRFGWAKGVAGVTANLGAVYDDYLYDYAKAFDYQRRALRLREKIFDRRGIKQSYLNLASLYCRMGAYSTALDYLERAQKLNELIPEKHIEIQIQHNRGENCIRLGDFVGAQKALDSALRMAEESQFQQLKISTLNRFAEWHERLGELGTAREMAIQAKNSAHHTDSKLEELVASLSLARIEIAQKDWKALEPWLQNAYEIAERLHHLDLQAMAKLYEAKAEYLRENVERCRTLLSDIREIVHHSQDPFLRIQYFLLRGQAAGAKRDAYMQTGAEDLHQALRLTDAIQDGDLIAEAHYRLGQWYQAQADWPDTRKHFLLGAAVLRGVAERLPQDLQKKYLEKAERNTILKAADSLQEEQHEAIMNAPSAGPSSLHTQNYAITLFQISKLVNSMLNLNELLERVMDLVLEAIRVQRGLILLVNEDSGDLEVKAARNISKETIEDATAISKSVLEDVVEGGKPLISVNAKDDQRLRERQSIVDFGIGMVLCIPLTVKQKIIGAVYIDNPIATLPFTEDDVNFLMSFTNLFSIAIENARLYDKLHQENIYLRQEVRGKYKYENIIGRSPQMMELFRRLDNVVNSSANVLIFGESGTGKELIARAIHYNGSRKEKRFIAIDCGAIPENLIESELFGYRRGAFTGALTDRKGLFEEADGGTVFLDEVTNTSRTLQAKLLRAIQEREIRRVGDSVDRKVDVRIIAATNRDLRAMVRAGEFREDLYFRLNVLNLTIPPLRERQEDIPVLVNHVLKQLLAQNPGTVRSISREPLRLLKAYSFPGNVRELENLVESAFYMSAHEEIQIKDFPPDLARKAASPTSESRDPEPSAPPTAAEKTSSGTPEHELPPHELLKRAKELYRIMKHEGVPFWKAVKEPFMKRELPKGVVREVIKLGLVDSHGRYRDLLRDFHLDSSEYTVFMNFLRKYDCQVDYKPYRQKALTVS
ncbi:MAG: sigma 54-interacting transcriptional regulator [Acidobacteriia bacterium]|nr:sigma 54-interacting transcriptional regulator [Terriglobia bacterium]